MTQPNVHARGPSDPCAFSRSEIGPTTPAWRPRPQGLSRGRSPKGCRPWPARGPIIWKFAWKWALSARSCVVCCEWGEVDYGVRGSVRRPALLSACRPPARSPARQPSVGRWISGEDGGVVTLIDFLRPRCPPGDLRRRCVVRSHFGLQAVRAARLRRPRRTARRVARGPGCDGGRVPRQPAAASRCRGAEKRIARGRSRGDPARRQLHPGEPRMAEQRGR